MDVYDACLFVTENIAETRSVAQIVTCKFTHVNWSTSNATV